MIASDAEKRLWRGSWFELNGSPGTLMNEFLIKEFLDRIVESARVIQLRWPSIEYD